MPVPRAEGSTSSRRRRATRSSSATQNTLPAGSPPISAIQAASRRGSRWATKSATTRAAGAGKGGDDAGEEGLERLVPAVLLRVQRAVARDAPAVIAGGGRAQDV